MNNHKLKNETVTDIQMKSKEEVICRIKTEKSSNHHCKDIKFQNNALSSNSKQLEDKLILNHRRLTFVKANQINFKNNKTKSSEKIESPTSSIRKQGTFSQNLENITERKGNCEDNLFENIRKYLKETKLKENLRSRKLHHNRKKNEYNQTTIKTSRTKHYINIVRNIAESNCKVSEVTALNTLRFSPIYQATPHIDTKNESTSSQNP